MSIMSLAAGAQGGSLGTGCSGISTACSVPVMTQLLQKSVCVDSDCVVPVGIRF